MVSQPDSESDLFKLLMSSLPPWQYEFKLSHACESLSGAQRASDQQFDLGSHQGTGVLGAQQGTGVPSSLGPR